MFVSLPCLRRHVRILIQRLSLSTLLLKELIKSSFDKSLAILTLILLFNIRQKINFEFFDFKADIDNENLGKLNSSIRNPQKLYFPWPKIKISTLLSR